MAHPTLTPFVSSLDQIVAELEASVDRALAQNQLVVCCADLCHAKAVVMDLATGQEFCLAHFREIVIKEN